MTLPSRLGPWPGRFSRYSRPAGDPGRAGLHSPSFLGSLAMLELLRLLVIVGGLIIITFMVLLALPQCKLRRYV